MLELCIIMFLIFYLDTAIIGAISPVGDTTRTGHAEALVPAPITHGAAVRVPRTVVMAGDCNTGVFHQ